MTVDDRREKLIAKLALRFPQGASAERSVAYLQDLQGHRFTVGQVAKGIDRLIASWERTTFPPFATLLRICGEVRAAELAARRFAEDRKSRSTLQETPKT